MDHSMTRAWYFAYGSNLWIEQIIERIGPVHQGAEPPRVAWLANHQVAFNMNGGGGQVFANLITPGKGVYGVVYCLSPEALKKMDSYETGYDRRLIRVVLQDGAEMDAITYTADSAHVGNSGPPSPDYLQKILTGARQHGLPEPYIRELQTVGGIITGPPAFRS